MTALGFLLNELKNSVILNWPIWEKEISEFDWFYEQTEQCYILEGEVEVITDKANYNLKQGDFVSFRKGLKCYWKITKPVRKHYNFV